MSVWRYEVKKLLTAPAIVGFFAVCLLVNVLFCLTGISGYSSYVGKSSRETGTRVGDGFYQKLAQISEPEGTQEADYLEGLRIETEGMPNIFETFQASSIGEAAIVFYGITGEPARLLREKYERLQASVDVKAMRGEALDLYLAGQTNDEHESLSFMWSILTLEGALIGTLSMLLIIGYEHNSRTELSVFSTRKGRRLLKEKLWASLVVGLGAFIALWFATMLIYLAFHPYLADIWHSSVSSAFHEIYDLACYHPFITWDSFSVLGYSFAQLGISSALMVCFMLIGFVIGTRMKNTYLAFFTFLTAAMALLILPYLFTDAPWPVPYILNYNPAILWSAQGLWFTDGMSGYLWPHFETWGVLGSLLILTALSLTGFRHFRRRDFT